MASQVPTGVKVISVLYYIGAALGLILGILFLVGAGVVSEYLDQIASAGTFAAASQGIFIGLGIFVIAFAVLGFFIARGLWKAQKWARIVAIILAIISILFAILALVQGQLSSIVELIIHGVIGGYLLFSTKVKAAFA